MPCTTRLIFRIFGVFPIRTELMTSLVTATDCE